ncbi:hypothetical protein T440DRAFT_152220 [Plenodomus tracheiphilus IPT5]|uniref:Uncharacterized protein n=1 Tax=Plenodomus tracheiphilus IPT5 TaxID=1408161 RepID=A0A6A7B2S2_9PLEO|nr:hypothetical protein T440DRAFT_152220 [Plenodomus tracheiphilus IPT5]
MNDSNSVRLPYGLSCAHQNSRFGGKGVAMPWGQQTRQPISTLKELSRLPVTMTTDTTVTPLFSCQIPSRHHTKDRQGILRHKMGFVRNVRRINMGPATRKEKRSRTPKSIPSPHISVRKKNKQRAEPQVQPIKARKTMRPRTQMGASEDMPINIVSDDDEEPELGGRVDGASISSTTSGSESSPKSDLSRFCLEGRSPISTPLSQSIDSPSGSCHSRVFALRRSDSAPSAQLPFRTGTFHPRRDVITSEGRQSTSSNASSETADKLTPSRRKYARRHRREPSSSPSPNSRVGSKTDRSIKTPPNPLLDKGETEPASRPAPRLSRSKTVPSDPYKSPPWQPSENNVSLRNTTATSNRHPVLGQGHSSAVETLQGAAELSLADIRDFDSRSKVAQLMAVAPAFSVRELYDLLKDCKGRFVPAKARVLRASVSRHSVAPQPSQDADADDIMVKIDPNDSFLEWDQDEPYELEHTMSRSNATKSRSRTHRNEYTPNPPSRPQTRSRPSTRPAVPERPRTGAATKKLRSALRPRSCLRETSSDRDFIAPDDETPEVLTDASDSSRASSSTSNGKGSDSDKDPVTYQDAMDLDIDMQPRYAFNAELLHLRKKGLGAFI